MEEKPEFARKLVPGLLRKHFFLEDKKAFAFLPAEDIGVDETILGYQLTV